MTSERFRVGLYKEKSDSHGPSSPVPHGDASVGPHSNAGLFDWEELADACVPEPVNAASVYNIALGDDGDDEDIEASGANISFSIVTEEEEGEATDKAAVDVGAIIEAEAAGGD